MTTWSACVGCGKGSPRSELARGRCAKCLAKNPRLLAKVVTGSWSPDRDRNAHARWARKIKARAGGQCEATEGIMRCPVTSGCQAHHLRPGYELEDGAYLCTRHHQALHSHGIGKAS